MNKYSKTFAAIVLLSSTVLPGFCDQPSRPLPQSLADSPYIKGGELGQYSSTYIQGKKFWGDDNISKSFAKTADQLKHALTPETKPNVDLAQARYNFYKAQFENRARQLNQEQTAQQAQSLHQYADLYRWSGDNTRR